MKYIKGYWEVSKVNTFSMETIRELELKADMKSMEGFSKPILEHVCVFIGMLQKRLKVRYC